MDKFITLSRSLRIRLLWVGLFDMLLKLSDELERRPDIISPLLYMNKGFFIVPAPLSHEVVNGDDGACRDSFDAVYKHVRRP